MSTPVFLFFGALVLLAVLLLDVLPLVRWRRDFERGLGRMQRTRDSRDRGEPPTS